MKRISILFAVLLLSGLVSAVNSDNEIRMMRFPDIYKDKLVFSCAGDLYLSSAEGGVARRITSDIGYEMFPRFSPDGKMIAFTGQYDGNTEVYVMPAEGGEPKRLTFSATLSRDDAGDRMGPNNIVMEWTPDGKYILYRTRGYSFENFTGQLMIVPADGGTPEKVPLVKGGFASYSPDGTKLAYNYVFREFRTWKHYHGGMADDIRIFDFNTKVSEKITDNINQDIIPMWSPDGSKIYYLSDRNGCMNLFSYNLSSKATEQLTNFRDYDIKFPAIGVNAIVYENGGDLYKYNLQDGKNEKICIYIKNDIPWSRPEWKNLSGSLTDFSLSRDGERILATARGDIFSIPVKSGSVYNLTRSSDANDRLASWAPDGNCFAYVSDKDGEFNIWIRDNKTGTEKRITDIKGYILDIKWSPDSKMIAWNDKQNTLNILEIRTGINTVIERSGINVIKEYNWSPDSRHIAYTRPGERVNRVMVYNVNEKSTTAITDEWYNSGSPAFSKEGKHLLFVSARTFIPSYSQTEFNHVYTKMNKVYILPLTDDAFIPFTLNPGSVNPGDQVPETLNYNYNNISSRIIELPVEGGGYWNLNMIGPLVYYNTKNTTYTFDLENKRETDLKVQIIFSPGFKKALAISGSTLQVSDVPKTPVTISSPISLAGVTKYVNYHQEWMQIFKEAWRQMRDLFYARNMHGIDWEKVYKKYVSLVPGINHRTDLTYLIGEMMGELNVGHAYSQNGEHPVKQKIKTGLTGAEFSRDRSGYFKVEKILQGANWDEDTRSPFTLPGSEVKEGEYIISINGISVKDYGNLNELLDGRAGVVTEFEVNSSPEPAGSRKLLIKPLSDESSLRYYNWVENNIRKVNDSTNGEIGYVHIPDMGVSGLNEFAKHYYPQLSKKGLIIDDRGNGGGNVSPMIIERLQRTIAFMTMQTNDKEGSANPQGTFDGPKVLLINEYSASDGDLFPYRFKYYNLGTVIGHRSWGGVVGYGGFIPAVDGGSIITPSYAPFAADGSGWIIEGEGVSPDIEVVNDPYKEFRGEDEQLNKAIEIIKQQVKQYKYKSSVIPPFPYKSPDNGKTKTK